MVVLRWLWWPLMACTELLHRISFAHGMRCWWICVAADGTRTPGGHGSMAIHTDHDLRALVDRLRSLPAENEIVEFKSSFAAPDEIGKYVSALANSAVLASSDHAYIVWGVGDSDDHPVVGTSFDPVSARKGGEHLENWLVRMLEPDVGLEFFCGEIDSKRVVVLRIGRAYAHPARFSGVGYVRIGSYRQRLANYPSREKELWRALDRTPFERLAAVDGLSGADVIRLLDVETVFDLLGRPLPATEDLACDYLQQDGLIARKDDGQWSITNLGALIAARDISAFPHVRRKAWRIVVLSWK